MTLLPLQKPASETTPAEEIKAAPREYALFVQGESSPEKLEAIVKQYGKGEANAAATSFSEVKDVLHRDCSHACEGSGNCLAFAARDESGHLAPFRFDRKPVGPTDIRIQITHCGMCHSDLHQIKGEWGNSKWPMVPGHEIVGVVTEVGEDVTEFKVGDHAGIGCMVDSCRKCEPCKSGEENYCSGSGPVWTYNSSFPDGTVAQGGYSTHYVVDKAFALHVSKSLPLDAAAPLLCAGITTYSPMRHFGLDQPGMKIGVIGLGGLGHMAVKWGKAFGCEVTVLSTSPNKKEEALERLGADNFVVSKSEEDMKAAAGTLHGIIDTVAAPHDMQPYLSLLRINGKLVLVGLPTEPFQVSSATLAGKRITVAGSMIGGIPETQEMLDFAAEKGITCDIETVQIDSVNEAMERMKKNDVRYRFVLPPVRPSVVAANAWLPPGRGYDWSLSGYREGADMPNPGPVEVYNVKDDYGAKGDNRTDDTAALTAAVKAASNNSAGGVVYLPAGVYILRRQIEVTTANVVFRGEGEQATIIRIPLSLSDAYTEDGKPTTWYIDDKGVIHSIWSFGGSFFHFLGKSMRSAQTGNRLATINESLPEGTYRIPVDSSAKFSVGQWVRIYVNDESTAATGTEFGAATDNTVSVTAITNAAGTATLGQLVIRPVPDRFKRDAMFQAALQSAVEQQASDSGQGLTPAQALAASAATAPRNPDSVTAAAAPGTVVAWLYGDGLADSGGTKCAVSPDDVSITAKVTLVDGRWIEIDRELPFPVNPGWQAVVHSYNPTVQDGGMEKLTIAFDHSTWAGHFTDRGYNAIEFSNSANMWLNQVTILNSDNAVFVGWTDHSSFLNVTVGVTRRRWMDKDFRRAENGHHAFGIAHSHANLVDGFNIASKYIHDLTVSWGANLNVFTSGKGEDVNCDHHRSGPFANLFTDINMGYGLRPFASGGAKDRAAYTGIGSTFWNLRAQTRAPPPMTWPPPPSPPPRKLLEVAELQSSSAQQLAAQGRRLATLETLRPLVLPTCDWGPRLNFYGSFTGIDLCVSKLWIVGPINGTMPDNLWKAQKQAPQQTLCRTLNILPPEVLLDSTATLDLSGSRSSKTVAPPAALMSASCLGFIVALLGCVVASAQAQVLPPVRPSVVAANAWLPPGRGYDWSLSGYKGGVGMPNPPVTINVKSHGAKGDNRTDDTAALTAAIKAATDNPAGGVVYLPAGVYILRQPVVIKTAKVVIRGDGPQATIIRIPVSLSDVYDGTWSQAANGDITSQWSFGGSFFLFQGRTSRTSKPATFLANINATVAVGGYRIPVDSSAKFTVGQWVRIFVNDASTKGRRRLKATGTTLSTTTGGAVSVAAITNAAGTATIGRLITRPVPQRLQQDPVFMAALQAAAEQRAGDQEPGLTPAQALAASAATAPRNPDSVTAAAAPGTVIAWLYGDGLADSGPTSGAVSPDDISITAKVTVVDGRWIEIDRELPFPVQQGWQAVVHSYNPTVQDGGMEKLTIAFDHSMWAGHFTDRGYNAIAFASSVNMWLRQVTVLNSDNAVFVGWTDHSTFIDLTVGVTSRRWMDKDFKRAENGHHAVGITHSHANLVDGFNIASKYIHDLTVSWGANLNVFTRGKGEDVNCDHHRSGPFANLFTDINMGYGLRPFASGGAKGRAAYTELRSSRAQQLAAQGRRLAPLETLRPLVLPTCDWGPRLNFYGSFTGKDLCVSKLWIVGPINGTMPDNLWIAQRQARADALKLSG
ncbi:putative cinnamyl alcohol dehydrogenase 2 [Chlorella vulgaris]